MTTPEPGTSTAGASGYAVSVGATSPAPPSAPPLQPQQFGPDAYKMARMGQLYQRSLRTTPLRSIVNNPPPMT